MADKDCSCALVEVKGLDKVYVKAKECSERLSVADFTIKLAKHFTTFYDVVTSAIVKIVEKQWECISVDGQQHKHGFKLGSEKHTTEVQSGFEGFIRGKYTILP